jgi:hypothetical protein
MLEIFRPAQYLNSIYEIDFEGLKKSGVEAVILDLDETLLPRELLHITPALFSFIEGIKEKGLKICLISNSLYPERVEYAARTLKLPYITLAAKPLPFAFNRALRELKTTANKCVVVGDQLFMDILGGNLMGMRTILVKPMSRETFWLRSLMRRAERWVLRRLGLLS